jgi:1,4-dihydroxy-6-naphthoate synthase
MITISVAHSPDSDDAFMFYALAQEKIPTGDLHFVHTLVDIETLNQLAAEGKYDVTALSFHAYAYRADRYRLLPCGASFGEDYGPKIIARKVLKRAELRKMTVAIPGKLTTAALVLQLYAPGIQTTVLPFEESDLVQHLDLGVWWKGKTGLPLPLGGNAIRRDLPEEVQRQVATYLRRAIDYALRHRKEALEYALGFGRGLDPAKADEFVGMYVNDVTREYGERGRSAVRRLLQEAFQAGIIPQPVEPEFVDWWEEQ